jgi:CheY-like chemotaxis protein
LAKPTLQTVQTVVPGKTIKKKILIAEDNQINQKVALRMLALLGYDADVAENGVEVLRLLENGDYSAVLMDIHMPVMDGMEATQAIRSLDSTLSRIPIIALTANVVHGERQKCLAAGMNDFITKPIEREKFAAALKHWIVEYPEAQLLSA